MTCKTISGHYDTVYSLDHNNRKIIPQNVDYSRIPRNYNCIAAGTEVYLDLEDPRCLAEFWTRYRELTELYWKDRAILKAREYEQYKERMRYLRQLSYRLRQCPEDGAGLIVFLLCLPLIVTSGILLSQQRQQLQEELDAIKEQQWLRDMEFQATKLSFRKALQEYDQIGGTRYLHHLDTVVKEMASCADDYLTTAQELSFTPKPLPRYATLEEIYDKLYEPSFRAFQEKQRPCRRYNGTYLEKIREDRHEAAKAKQQTKNAKNRKTAEAIELVIGIGDMDNTGYHNAPVDAYQSEILLKDYCDHLMQSEKVCFVTTKDLDTPGWQPPFKNGLIVLNLTVHCDEATPGIHLTCIPYSRGCKRGPEVQAALSRAMTGMGYPSTWKDVLDENGERIPKRDKYGKVIHNADGTVRYKQEADGQGIIDWIEDQKRWIQHEMEQRYGWEREYKGAHPRGNLSTPDYQVARAKERCEMIQNRAEQELIIYNERINGLAKMLDADVDKLFQNENTLAFIVRYLKMCSQERFDEFLREAESYFDSLPTTEQKKAKRSLQKIIDDAQNIKKPQNSSDREATPQIGR
jgi:hypothetical protein